MIDVAHDRHHRRARLQRLGGIDVVGVSMSTSLSLTRLMLWPNSVTSSSAVSWSMVWVTRDRHAHLEQGLDQVGAALGHAVGEFLDGDRFGNDDVADLLGGGPGFLVVALFLFAGAAQRGQAAGAAVVLARQGAGDGQLAALAAIVAAARPGAPARGAWAAGAGRRGRRWPRSSSSSRRAARSSAPARLRRRFGGGCFGLGGACSAASSSARRLSSARRFSSSVCSTLDAVLAAARFLELRQARFFGLAQQLLLHFARAA